MAFNRLNDSMAKCHVGSHSVTCYPTHVNALCLTPARKAGSGTHLPTTEGWKAELIYSVSQKNPPPSEGS